MAKTHTITTAMYQGAEKEHAAEQPKLQEGLKDTSPVEIVQEPTQKIMHISMATYVSTLSSAMMSSKYALACELATSLAIFTEMGGTTRNAKRTLLSVYAQAGYDCSNSEGSEYKTCSRRIMAASLLMERLGAETIEGWIAGAAESQALQAIIAGLEPMKLHSVDAVFAYCGRVRLPAAKATPTQIEGEKQNKKQPEEKATQATAKEAEGQLEPGEIILPEDKIQPKAEEHIDKELPDDVAGPRWMRRAEDKPENIFKTVDTQHIHIALSKDADRTEIIAAAMKLLSIAEEMNNGHDGAVEVKGALQTELSKLTEEVPLQAELRNVPEPMKKPRGRRVVTR